LDNLIQFANAFAPIDSLVSERITEANEIQFENVESEISFSDERILREVKFLQFDKDYASNVTRNDELMSKEPSKPQFENDEAPIVSMFVPMIKSPRS
jgi:hypothetical protein